MKKILCAAAMSAAAFNVAYAEHHKGEEHKAAEAPEFSGAFTGEEGGVITFLPAGYVVIANETGVAGFIVKYGAKDGEMWLKNVTAPPDAEAQGAECVVNNKGRYGYSEEGGVLIFTLIEDPCPNRAEAVTSAMLTRMETPEPEVAEAAEEPVEEE